MINNVKVQPLIKIEDPENKERIYKASFSQSKKQKMYIVIVLPFSVPDNIVKSCAKEAKKCLV